ncbi:TetR/AcrR family transcriptional regulator [Nesterenkonia ebinurensis]|uniref:TetR/AcrR family transcriptional regulator n=1 Tax=Nesterenkonia ebinurensis TaxID=2608252 RepID=UPI001CC5D47D|nr:TetR family transcriptional regulator [Nesterenkonia ebinurensis]
MSANGQERQPSRSFIEEARREQIVASAIAVIAEHGYPAATMGRIAQHAGVSRSLINYHFAGREDLIGQLVVDVFTRGAQAIVPRVETASTPAERLAAYIGANLDFIAGNRRDIVALVRVAAALDTADGLPGVDPAGADQGLEYLRRILRDGQDAGQFAAFDVHQMAVAVRNVIDGVSTQVATDPNLDLAMVTREVAALFHRATRDTGE